MDVKGMIFHNQHDTWTSYSLGISSKNQDGKYENASMPIRFKTDTPIPGDRTRILVTDGWLKPIKFGKDANGKDRYVVGVFCKAYETLGEASGFSAIVDDDVPF